VRLNVTARLRRQCWKFTQNAVYFYRDYRARIEPLLAAPIAPDILDTIEP
jgi:hypothetical protein